MKGVAFFEDDAAKELLKATIAQGCQEAVEIATAGSGEPEMMSGLVN